MNALIEFIILTAGSFFLFMFLAFKDALRTKAPKGPVAGLLNKINGWEYTDRKGIRGYLYRQPMWMKFVLSLISALLIRMIYAIFFDFVIATETFNIFTGFTAWLFHAGIIFLGIMLSYMWPKVRDKMVDIKDDAIKKTEETVKKVPPLMKKEEAEEKKKEEKEESENSADPDPEPPKKDPDSPDDIINDYLK